MPNEPIYIPPHPSQGLPLQAGEVALFAPRRGWWATALRWALELAALGALVLVFIGFLALRS